MGKLSEKQRREIVGYLEAGQEIPDDYKHVLFPPERREYELVYAGKEREEDIIANTWGVPLQAVKTFNLPKTDPRPEWTNRLIFGDNLQVMKRLLDDPEVKGKVKLVYIDPPFTSQTLFHANTSERAYQDKIVGAQFVEFMRKRLVLLRELLSRDGSLFVHLDQRMAHYIKIVLDDVFGEHNFRNEIVLPGRASKNLQQQFDQISRLNVRHDVLLWYSASSATRFSPLWVEKHNKGNPEGHWHHFWSTADRHTMRYELFGNKPETGQWTWKKERALEAVENYDRYLQEAGGRTLAEYWRDTGCKLSFVRKNPKDGSPQYWRAPAVDRLADTVWAGIPIYSNSTKYPTEKSEKLLEQIAELTTAKGDLVLDAFAGSGTTLVVATRMQRKWIGIDCGKLSVYTMQKRVLATASVGPFTLYNAGLYDFKRMSELLWNDYRLFALQLFQVRDKKHTLAGIELDGFKNDADVLVFNFKDDGDIVVDEGYVADLHRHIAGRARDEFYIIAPASRVTFLEDYMDHGRTRYYILRIPYSIIDELHDRPFEQIRQPVDETEINNTVEAVGFDFIIPPIVKAAYRIEKPKGELFNDATITIEKFSSEAMTKKPRHFENRETLSMVMVDYDYKGNGEVLFDLDAAFYRDAIEKDDWKVRLDASQFGEKIMIIFMDIFGNELREVKTPSDFGIQVGSIGKKPARRGKVRLPPWMSATTTLGKAPPRRGRARLHAKPRRRPPRGESDRWPKGSRGFRTRIWCFVYGEASTRRSSISGNTRPSSIRFAANANTRGRPFGRPATSCLVEPTGTHGNWRRKTGKKAKSFRRSTPLSAAWNGC